MNNICVVGVGYVGLVTGACFSDLGNKIIALDISEKRIENLRNGILPIYEPGLKEVVERNVKANRLSFTTNYDEALKDAEFVFICVGTPEGVDGEADLQYVRMAAESIAQNMDHPLVIINKSTVPVGTGDWVASIVRENQPKPIPFSVVSCPEFLREGQAIRDFFNPDRTVLGSTDKDAAHRVAQLHLALRAPIVVTDLRTAEMIKYASNAFLATRISFINEIANICEALGADVKEVAQGMGYDKRIGHYFLEPGVGYGGSCFEGEESILVLEKSKITARTLKSLFEESGQIFNGDEVELVTPNGKRVLAFDLTTGCPSVAEVRAFTRRQYIGTMITIRTSDQRSLKVTADHPIIRYSEAGVEIIPASELSSGDQLMALKDLVGTNALHDIDISELSNGAELDLDKVDSVEIEEVRTTVYSLETTTGTVIAQSALVLHNCFPKDVKALTYMAQVNGSHPELLEAVMGINKTQRDKIVLKLQDMLGTVEGKTIALLGLAFKENTDDIRESPAMYVAAMLHEQGADVRGYDPVAAENVQRAAPYIQLCNDPYELAKGSDAVVVMTPWNEFKSLDMEQIYKAMKQPILVDGRNLYDGQRMKQIGFRYRGVGRGFNGSMDTTNGKSDGNNK